MVLRRRGLFLQCFACLAAHRGSECFACLALHSKGALREESSSRRTAEASTLQRVDVENRPLGFKVGTFERGFLCSFIFIDLFIIWHIFLWKHVQYNAFLPVSNSCCCRGNIWTIHRGSVVEFPCRVLGGHAGKHTYIFSLHSEGDANA